MKIITPIPALLLAVLTSIWAIDRVAAQPYVSFPYTNNFGQDTPGQGDPDFYTSSTSDSILTGNYWTIVSPGITNDNLPNFPANPSMNGYLMQVTNNEPTVYNCAVVQLNPSVIAPPQPFAISSDFQINALNVNREAYIGLVALGNHSDLGHVGGGYGSFIWGELQLSTTLHNGTGNSSFVNFENGGGGSVGITQGSLVGADLPINTNDVYNLTIVGTYDFNTNLDLTLTSIDLTRQLTNSRSESITYLTATNYFLSTSIHPGNGTYFGYCDREDSDNNGNDNPPYQTNIVTHNKFSLLPASNPSGLGDPVPISVTVSPTNQFVGNTATLNAAFSGAEPMYFAWQFGGTNLSFTNTITAYSTNQVVLTNALVLSNLQLTNAGYYRCVASNSLSISNTVWAYLNILPVPASPMIDVQAVDGFNGGYFYQGPGVIGTLADEWNYVDTSATALTNSNIPLFNSAGAATSVQLSYTPGVATFINSSAIIPLFSQYLQSTTNTVVTLSGLQPNASYNVVVYAIGNAFQGSVVTGAVNASTTAGPALVSDVGGFTNGVNYVENQSALSDGGGNLTFSVAPLSGNTYSAWNGFQIVASSVPRASIQNLGGNQLKVTWSGGQGLLLQSTSLLGPWTTNSATSPYTFTPSGPEEFFKAE